MGRYNIIRVDPEGHRVEVAGPYDASDYWEALSAWQVDETRRLIAEESVHSSMFTYWYSCGCIHVLVLNDAAPPYVERAIQRPCKEHVADYVQSNLHAARDQYELLAAEQDAFGFIDRERYEAVLDESLS